jgi:hypothetical protein
MDWELLQELVDKVSDSICEVEMVDGVYEGVDPMLDRFVYALAQALGEVLVYVGEAVDASKLMK